VALPALIGDQGSRIILNLIPKRYDWLKDDLVVKRSVDVQRVGATRAATRATEVAAITVGRLHDDFEASRSRDHGGCNIDRELGTAGHGGGDSGAIEDHKGGGNEMVASGSDDEGGGQL